MCVRAPKRYHKLYLVTVWRSKSGSWRAARREASWRVVDERGDHGLSEQREGSRPSLESCEGTRKRRRESLRGGSVHMNVSSRATIATWSSMMLKAPRIPREADPARDIPPAVRPSPARPPGGMLIACRYGYMHVQMSPSTCVVCRFHPQSAW